MQEQIDDNINANKSQTIDKQQPTEAIQNKSRAIDDMHTAKCGCVCCCVSVVLAVVVTMQEIDHHHTSGQKK